VNLTTDTELADLFGIDIEKLHDLRKSQKWPHVKLGRFEYRFTDDQIAEIVERHSIKPKRLAGVDSGLTERSARRSS
jgi:hypothetical protein